MSRIIFPEWTESLKKWVGLLALGAPIYIIGFLTLATDAKTIRTGYAPVQPVPYSHALHVGELGLDCRYCHSTVEKGAKAAIPPAATCMNCHATVLPNSEKLLPVRQAFAGDVPLKWVRVHDLPDYVYFNHSAHTSVGVGCETCHGRIDKMAVVEQVAPLTMSWCLDCHRNAAPNIRPVGRLTEMGYDPSSRSPTETVAVPNPPTNCSTCHR